MTVDKIHKRIFHNRLSQDKDYSQWVMIEIKSIRGKMDETIAQWLQEGKTVSGGYYTTSVRGYHIYYVMYKRT